MNRWPRNKAYFWEVAPFFRILLPFAAGILCYYKGWLGAINIVSLVWVAIVSFVSLGILALGKTRGVYGLLAFVLINTGLFASGFSISGFNDVRNDKQWFGNYIKPTNTYIARITSTPDEKENTWKLSVNVLFAIDSGKITTTLGKAFVYVQKDSLPFRMHKGDTIILPEKWQALKDAGNPFEFSYATYCARNNIMYRQWCTKYEVWRYGKCNPASLPLTERTHDWCMRQLQQHLGIHKAMGLLQAMLLGDEVNLDEDLRQSYAETGIIHIIAISGGNVSIFFMVIAFLLGWIKHKKYDWVKYALALPIIWFYVLMAGGQPSAVRAAVLFSLLAIGILFQKNNNGINHLFATAFLLLLAEPAWLFAVGFQLSFVAVLSIMLFYKPVYNWLPLPAPKTKHMGFRKKVLLWVYVIPRALWGAVAMSIAAEILVAPLVIYYFHNFPVMFIIANVAAYLFMGIVLVLGMLLVTFSAIPLLAGHLATVIMWLVDTFGVLVGHMQGVGPLSFHFLMLSGYETIMLYLVIACAAWYLLRQNKRALFISLTASCLLVFSFCVSEWDNLHRQALVVYNVAHANHIELINGSYNSTLFTDTSRGKQMQYATTPALIGWQAWHQRAARDTEIISINGKTALVLNHAITGKETFPVNYLVLNYKGIVNIPLLQQQFSPSTIVVGNNYSKEKQSVIKAACDSLGIAAHLVAEQGACVLGN